MASRQNHRDDAETRARKNGAGYLLKIIPRPISALWKLLALVPGAEPREVGLWEEPAEPSGPNWSSAMRSTRS